MYVIKRKDESVYIGSFDQEGLIFTNLIDYAIKLPDRGIAFSFLRVLQACCEFDFDIVVCEL